MSEQQNNENATPEAPKPTRPRREDGTFMSKTEIEALEARSIQSDKTISANNKALMRATPFKESNFKGMDDYAINKFLLNYHKNRESEDTQQEEQAREPNQSIIGTPIGSGKDRMFIDKYLTMDPKAHGGRGSLDFEAPASIVFAQHKNKIEADKKWLDRR